MRRVKVYFDGGCRPDLGRMEIAVVVGGEAIVLPDLGHGSSMEAEWLALLEALRIARTRNLPEFVLIGDAADVVAKANGTVKARGIAGQYVEAFRALAGPGKLPPVRHVKRSQNLAGIALARRHPR